MTVSEGRCKGQGKDKAKVSLVRNTGQRSSQRWLRREATRRARLGSTVRPPGTLLQVRVNRYLNTHYLYLLLYLRGLPRYSIDVSIVHCAVDFSNSSATPNPPFLTVEDTLPIHYDDDNTGSQYILALIAGRATSGIIKEAPTKPIITLIP